MSVATRSMAFWPGLINLWNRGELYSLFVALLFASLLNIALMSTLIWEEWLASWLSRALWLTVAGASLWSFAASLIFGSRPRESLSVLESDQLLTVAQQDYLKGDYLEAEAGLHRILASGREDIEAALLLASVMRRTGRKRQALDCLDRLEKFERATLWALEIGKERKKLTDAPPKAVLDS